MGTVVEVGQGTDSINSLGDAVGGYYGQSFIAEGSTLNQVKFIVTSWSGGTTDYKVVITTFENDHPGTILATSDLLTLNAAGDVVVDFPSIPVAPGQKYAFLIDTTYGTSTSGDGSYAGASSDYSGGDFFYNHNEDADGNHDLSYVNYYYISDFSFTLVFGASAPTQTVNGSGVADTFTASNDDNYVYSGFGGNDIITTAGGNDTIRGGNGNDTISSGGGNDTIIYSGTGEGYDSVDGGAGTDRIVAGANGTLIGLTSISGVEAISANGFSNVAIVGSGYADNLDFSGTTLTGINRIDVGGGNDTVIGSAGADTIIGGLGDDRLSGGGGDDLFLFSGNAGKDIIDGGDGYDVIRATAANATMIWGSVTNVEEISGGGFAGVKIVGTGSGDTIDLSGITVSGIASIDGGAGNDTVVGSEQGDTIIGNTGNDLLYGQSGDDVFLFATSAGTDTIDGGDGYDVVRATAANSTLTWGNITGVEEISSGGFAGVKIVGGTGGDYIDLTGIVVTGVAIDGGNGADTIIGSAGNDVIIGGLGADLLTGGEGSDLFRYEAVAQSRVTSGLDRITDFQSGADRIDLSGMDANSAVAGRQSFTFIGDAAFSGAAGELRFATVGSDTYVSGDVDGNKIADFQVVLTGTHALTSADFIFAGV